MAKEWIVACKDCGKDFGYSDWSNRIGETKGQSRPERCPECRKKHNRQTALMGAAYFEIKPRANVDTSKIHPGSLGVLSHPKREHKAFEKESGFDPEKFGVSDDDIRNLFQWFDDPKHQVAVVVGPTGSGKSTALPYRLINPPSGIPEDRFTKYGQVLITQPRIQATRNIPAYVAKDLYGSSIGSGFDVGFRYKNNPFSDWRNRLVYATDGTVINWIANGQIANLSVIMIDEAHERSLNIDLILGLLKKLLPRYPHLKLIVASATIDSGLFVEYYGKETAKLIEFQGKRKFNVDTYFMDESTQLPYDSLPKLLKTVSSEVAKKVVWLLEEIAKGNKPSGDILAFLQGEKPIEQAVTQIRQGVKGNEKLNNVDVFPLYTTLPQEDQNKALLKKPDPSRRRVVVTTNVAETSLTVEDIVYVVDSGLINESQWQIASQTKQVVTVLHSQAGCKQRWGRGGRVKDGQAYCLYTEAQFKNLFPEFTKPQIQRSDLEAVVLAAKAAGIDDLTTFEWIQKPPLDELERAPNALKKIGALDQDGFLTEHGLELQSFGDEPAIGHLMAMADRFSCAIEMATLISMLKLSGMKYLFKNERKWDATTRREVNRIHNSLMKGCEDDIELCLKIYTAWSDPDYQGQSLTTSWAFRQIWLKHIPVPNKQLRDELKEKKLDQLKADVISVTSDKDLESLAKKYGDSDGMKSWVENAKLGMRRAKREAWAKANFINHSLLKNKVEKERDTLLESLSGHKKEDERRPINFDLLDRVRIIFAYCLPDRRYKLDDSGSLGANNIANYKSFGKKDSSKNDNPADVSVVQINQDSVFYGQNPDVFVCGRQQVVTRRISPDLPVMPVVYVSYVCLIRKEWIPLLEKGNITDISLATFISQQVRDLTNGKLKQTHTYDRLFLDQIFPVGSRFQCKITSLNSKTIELEPLKIISDPIEIYEDFRGDEVSIPETADIVENVDTETGDLVDTVLTDADAPVANPEEDVEPSWMDLEGHPIDDSFIIEDQDIAKLEKSEALDIKRFTKKYRWRLQVSETEKKFKAGDIIKADVYDFDFSEKDKFVVVFQAVPEPEPFSVFSKKFKVNDVISVKTKLYDEKPGDYLVSMVVVEPLSGLEIVLEPEKMCFSTRGFVIKEIPIGIEIKAVVENIDSARRRVSLSSLPSVEEHLNTQIAQQRSKDGVFELESALVGEVSQERIFLILPWSDPAKGLIHVVSVAGRGLYKSAENFVVGEKCRVRVSLPQNTAHRAISEIPDEVNSLIEKKQREFANLSWDKTTLYYSGRMTNSVRTNLKSPTQNRNYHRAIDDLYRFSNQLMVDTLDPKWLELAAKYKVGQKIKVTIVRMADFGAFGKIEDGLEGLIHKSKMAWGGVDDPNKILKVEGIVEVTIEKIDMEKRQIGLSMLKAEGDPFTKYKIGQRKTGKINKIIAAGLIVELEPGVSGLVHISQVSRDFMTPEKLEQEFEIGDEVGVLIIGVELDKRRISLSIKQA